jgi:hypothetical protein
MTDENPNGMEVQDEDRLPWLEAVDNDDEDEGISPSRLIAGVIGALLAIGLIIGGVFWLKERNARASGDGELIAAAEGDYKVRPDEPGGMKVDGTGDVAYNVSEGGEASGSINLDNQPEAPVKVPGQVTNADAAMAAAKPVNPAGTSVTAKVAGGEKLPPPLPKPMTPVVKKPVATAVVAPAPTAAGTGGAGGTIQLGAFSSADSADKAWNSLTSRHAALKAMGKQVVTATVNGATVYRLRASAGANAAQTCATLKAAGASCNVVK